MKVFASIDVGSNSVRMLIAGKEDGEIKRLRYERRTTRLAKGFPGGNQISLENAELTAKALREYLEVLSGYQLEGFRAVGTSALREAVNGREITEYLEREAGFKIDVICVEEEARLSAKGVTGFLDINTAMILDIGGGSTEWIIWSGRKLVKSGSIPVGVVKLAGMCAPPGFPCPKAIASIEDASARIISKTGSYEKGAFVLTGGTASTLAMVDLALESYNHGLVQGHRVNMDRLHEIYGMIDRTPVTERDSIKGLPADRADLIMPGVSLTINIMVAGGFRELTVSGTGLPEGIILELTGGLNEY